MKRVIMSVISDLSTDQRVHKVALFLQEQGADLLVVGRRFSDTTELSPRPYKTHRLTCRYRKGIFQYLEFNLKLFLFLLKQHTEILVANDLDTLLPNYLNSIRKKVPLVYDSHEYFTGVPELKDRPIKRGIWKLLEKWLLPKLRYSYTVNDSIRDLYKKEFGIDMKVVRNLPLKREAGFDGLPIQETGKTTLVMQGAGINNDRGYEEAILAMKFLPEDFILLIIGNGVALPGLKELVNKEKLQSKVQFIDRLPYEELMKYTRSAFLGLSLDKPVSINNTFSLPNKLFDYLSAGIPVICSALPEIKKIVEQFRVGICIDSVRPELIAETILAIKKDGDLYLRWKENTKAATTELNWDKEKPALAEIYHDLLK